MLHQTATTKKFKESDYKVTHKRNLRLFSSQIFINTTRLIKLRSRQSKIQGT
uniref:Uncharacterized protein n=1 Tax=Kalanchoe fedtschenkoi TaxID=63787 RepID=A0A7N0UCE3_KALFE